MVLLFKVIFIAYLNLELIKMVFLFMLLTTMRNVNLVPIKDNKI
jgi:hypothetical protein